MNYAVKNDTTMTTDKEILFRQKAEKYLCCFNDRCPSHTQCLRWEVGQCVDPAVRILTCISPNYLKPNQNRCHHFRDNQPLTMPIGMKKRFYYDMPARIAQAIKRTLINYNCRATYYKYHNGLRPITPDYLAVIQEACRQAGWKGPLEFDGEVTDYVFLTRASKYCNFAL